MYRPRIAIPGRFTESASALRARGVVSSRLLLELVWQAGGDPVTLLPAAGPEANEWAARLRCIDGVLLPGGGDVNPVRYGGDAQHPALYDVDNLQDELDFSLGDYAFANNLPLLAVCRGLHVVNALRGGSLVEDMPVNHRHHVHPVTVNDPADHLGLGGAAVTASCYHHQAVDRLGEGLTVLANAADGCVEAVKIETEAWSAAVQWHPEDTFNNDEVQLRLVTKFVNECRAAAGR